jgi:hypothetical protein
MISKKTSIVNNKQEELLLWNIKLKILMDYFEKNIISINEELLLDDIHTFVESEGLDIDSLSDNEYFSLNRLLGNIDEYYSLKNRKA